MARFCYSISRNYRTMYSPTSYSPYGGQRGFRWWPVLLFAVFGAIYYFSNLESVPITGREHIVTISREQEMQLGLQSYAEVLRSENVVTHGPHVNLIESVGARIAKVAEVSDFDWEFNLVLSDQVNAFCLPGGKVVVYSGILPVTANENGLAVVMGHEIAHALARHGAERMAQEQLAQFGLLALGMASSEMDESKRRAIMGVFGAGTRLGMLLPFSRKHESEADHIGLILMARACFDPKEAPVFWQRMAQASHGQKPPEFMSTHPSDERRVVDLGNWMEEAQRERDRYCN